MKNKFSITLLLVLTINFSYGQKFQKGSISYLDGSEKKGFLMVPKTSAEKMLLFKTNENSEKEKIECKLVGSITVYSDNGKSYAFENRYVNYSKNRVSKKRALILKISNGFANVYFAGNQYKTNEHGDVMINYSYYVGKDLPTFNYYLRKKGEENISFFAMTSSAPTMFGLNKLLKKNAAKLLFEDTELVERINNGEFKHGDVIEIMEIYNKFMANK
jgi:hypothetical protein